MVLGETMASGGRRDEAQPKWRVKCGTCGSLTSGGYGYGSRVVNSKSTGRDLYVAFML